MPEPISPDLAPYARGSVLALREWKTYTLTIPAAEALLVGSRLQQCHPAPGFFELEFQNQLGPTLLTPIVNGLPQSSVQVEVVASKFSSVRASIGFMTSIVSQLSARVSTLPFVMRANTARQMERMHREPSRFFAFHYLRHQTESLVRALQVIAADPHRKLDAIVEDLRIRQARAIDAEALHSLLVGPRAGSPNRAPNATPLERLQPLRIRQRRPEETYNTPENRFVVAVCHRLRTVLDEIQSAWWFEKDALQTDLDRIEALRRAIKLLLLSDRFVGVTASLQLPAYSRVLQNRHGYRELMVFWNGLTQVHQPVMAELDRAVDQRDVPTLYEFWLFFELAAAIEEYSGVAAEYPFVMDPYESKAPLKATFPGLGTLTTQESFGTNAIFTGITLRPDFVWRTWDGRRVALDAKFAMTSVAELQEDNDSAADYRATSRDIAKMHAYRDAIAGVDSAWVLFPGTVGQYWGADRGTRLVSSLHEILPELLSGETSGIGAIPMKPMGGL